MQINISYSNHITKNFKNIKIPFRKLCALVKSEFNYSAGAFKDGYRKADNYLNKSNVLILDIDDGVSIIEAKEIFKKYMNIIATTKSHQKDKNGIKCDRFRVIIPTQTDITLDKKEYSKMMEEVYKDFPFVDKVCKDASRFYFPSKDSIVTFNNGSNAFNWKPYHERAKYSEETRRRLANFRDAYNRRNNNYSDSNEETKIDYIRKIANTEKLLELLKYDEKFVAGQRNKTLFSYGKYFQDLGMDAEEVKNNLFFINNSGDSIPEEELIRTVFKSLRLN